MREKEKEYAGEKADQARDIVRARPNMHDCALPNTCAEDPAYAKAFAHMCKRKCAYPGEYAVFLHICAKFRVVAY